MEEYMKHYTENEKIQKIFLFNMSNVCTATSSYNRTNTGSTKNKGKKILDTSTD